MIWLSVLCPSCRPEDLRRWLLSLAACAVTPKDIQLSLIVERHQPLPEVAWFFGDIVLDTVEHGQYTVNELQERCYKQSDARFVMLSGDDTVCESPEWDVKLRNAVAGRGDVVLAYPDDGIFGETLACYPMTTRTVMDAVPWPLPYQRYCIDDTIFDIVPKDRRFYVPDVMFRHLHLRDQPPGHLVMRDGQPKYYPHEQPVFNEDRALYKSLAGQRAEIRERLRAVMYAQGQSAAVPLEDRTATA